ncbi:LEA type 2 family protein [Fulvivirga sp. 29W222]|uniref:LEA type 2 family protein n=1 Tax=Fulvivirga marina TaxID=2494733 RepID=A0A937KD69_9BACT|nr:LEA type 2 family protein [Fulvivirga marina]MBL6445730.1 LEA type 2 family protein [Fulvivirga marina]
MLKWIIGAGAGILTFGYLLKLNRASQTIQTKTKAKIHKVGLSGIAVKIYATIKNPNKLTITLQKPLVTISYGGKSLGTSQLEDEKITVPEFGQKTFEIDMNFGWLALTQSLGLSLVDAIRNKDKTSVNVDVIVTTTVNGIPYTDTETTTLSF